MDKIILICFFLFLVCLILFFKSIFIKSKLGKITGIIIYLFFTIFFGSITVESFLVRQDADNKAINKMKRNINIQYKCVLPPANIPKFLDKPNPGTVFCGKNKTNTSIKTNSNNSNSFIKANDKIINKGKIIGDIDSKIYHVPGSTYYNREMKKTSNNVYFNTIQEAEAAGYRAPKRWVLFLLSKMGWCYE